MKKVWLYKMKIIYQILFLIGVILFSGCGDDEASIAEDLLAKELAISVVPGSINALETKKTTCAKGFDTESEIDWGIKFSKFSLRWTSKTHDLVINSIKLKFPVDTKIDSVTFDEVDQLLGIKSQIIPAVKDGWGCLHDDSFADDCFVVHSNSLQNKQDNRPFTGVNSNNELTSCGMAFYGFSADGLVKDLTNDLVVRAEIEIRGILIDIETNLEDSIKKSISVDVVFSN